MASGGRGRPIPTAGRDDHLVGVDDERDLPVTENGRSGDARDFLIVLFEALDHDFALFGDAVDGEGVAMTGVALDQ